MTGYDLAAKRNNPKAWEKKSRGNSFRLNMPFYFVQFNINIVDIIFFSFVIYVSWLKSYGLVLSFFRKPPRKLFKENNRTQEALTSLQWSLRVDFGSTGHSNRCSTSLRRFDSLLILSSTSRARLGRLLSGLLFCIFLPYIDKDSIICTDNISFSLYR